MTFGRKGVVPGQAGQGETRRPPIPKPAIRSGGVTAYRTAEDQSEIQRLREEFVAQERARPDWQEPVRDDPQPSGEIQYPGYAARHYASGKSMFGAYLIWFFFGGVSAHRFYLGGLECGLKQVSLLVIAVIVLLIFPPLGVALFGLFWAWVLLDVVLIPGLHRKAMRGEF